MTNLLFSTMCPAEISLDAAEPWQLGSQDAASPMMQGIMDLHHDIFFFLILILVFVLWILVRAFWECHSKKKASVWQFLGFVFFGDFISFLKLNVFMWKFLRIAHKGCAEDPVPEKLWDRVLWYKKRIVAIIKLYRLMRANNKRKLS